METVLLFVVIFFLVAGLIALGNKKVTKEQQRPPYATAASGVLSLVLMAIILWLIGMIFL